MFANDMKKGMRVLLRNGWFGTMSDNAKGLTRIVDVEGFEREMGSVYTFDIAKVRSCENEESWQTVEFTPAQQKKIVAQKAWMQSLGML